MLTVEDIRARLAPHQDELRERGVASLEVFGSVARGDARPDSDVDMRVAFSKPVDLFDYFELGHRLEELLHVAKVDLMQKGAEHPRLQARIGGESKRVA